MVNLTEETLFVLAGRHAQFLPVIFIGNKVDLNQQRVICIFNLPGVTFSCPSCILIVQCMTILFGILTKWLNKHNITLCFMYFADSNAERGS